MSQLWELGCLLTNMLQQISSEYPSFCLYVFKCIGSIPRRGVNALVILIKLHYIPVRLANRVRGHHLNVDTTFTTYSTKFFCWSDLFLSFLVCVMVSVCLFRYHDRSVFITEIVQHTLLSTGADSSSSLFVFRFFLTILVYFSTLTWESTCPTLGKEKGKVFVISLFFFFWIKLN